MNQIKLVCFDLGGVLVQIASGWEEACRLAGVPRLAGEGKGISELIRDYERGALEESLYFERASRCFLDVTPDAMRRVFDAWLMGAFPAAEAVVQRLKSAGIPTACLSNTNARHWKVMRDYPAITALNHRFASYEILLSKPDEGAYRHVERHTGASGGQILFLDDRQENIEAAAAIGWQAQQVDPLRGAEHVAEIVQRMVLDPTGRP